MHHFNYRNGELFCEDVPVKAVVEASGTPCYLYSHATLTRHFQEFSNAFQGMDRLVCYSAKANTNLAILRLFEKMGGGLDIVSGGELYRGLAAGFSAECIVYSGVGKMVDEIDFALEEGILMFNVESIEELKLLNERAKTLGKTAPVALRVNPDVDPKTHPYISTGLNKNKFGIDTEGAMEGYRLAQTLSNIRVRGIDCHIGSQITESTPFKDALKSLVGLVRKLKDMGILLEHIDVGGGLGIIYDDESPPLPVEYARAIVGALKGTSLKLILEPGWVIVGNAGTLITRVLYRKKGKAKEFVIVDAAMNDLIRPSLYHAYHAVWPVVRTRRKKIRADVVGPICESGDFLAEDREMTDAKKGELLAVMSAGAYGFSMASNYCSRPRVAEVMVKGDRFHIVRARETYEDLIRGESIPAFIGAQ